MTDDSDAGARNAAFRREALHALSTPLGGLLLQAELVEQYLRRHKMEQAKDAVALFLRDFDAYAHTLRHVFAAIDDVSETGDGDAHPESCLRKALDELGDVGLEIDYRGDATKVAVPAVVLTAVMRRMALQMDAMNVRRATLIGAREGLSLRLTLQGPASDMPALGPRPFHPKGILDLWIARELVSRYRASLEAATSAGSILTMTLPVAQGS